MSKTTKVTKKSASAAPKLKRGASIVFRKFRGGESTGSYQSTETFGNGPYHTLKVDGEPYRIRTGQILSVNGVAV